MNLSGFLPLLRDELAYQDLIASVDGHNVATLDAAKPLLIASLHHDLKTPILVITPDAESAKRLHEELVAWCRTSVPVHLFPKLDVLPYEHLAPDSSTIQQRLRVLAALSGRNGSSPLIVASAHAVSQKTIPADDFTVRVLRKGERANLNSFLADLVAMGYEVGEMVEVSGEVSKRGGIIDIFSPNNEYPARIEFVGNEVESIRWFDPSTQRSMGSTESLTIVPGREMILPGIESLQEAFGNLDLSNCNSQTGDAIGEDLELLLNGQWRSGLEFYAPLFNNGTILDYFPHNSLVILDDPESVVAELTDLESQATELRQGQIERGELPHDFPVPYFTWAGLEKELRRVGQSLFLERWGGRDSNVVFEFKPATSYNGQMSRFLEDALRNLSDGRRIVVVSQQASRLAELFAEKNIPVSPVAQVDQLSPAGSLTLVHGSLYGGWSLGETSLFTDTELFGFLKKRRPVPKRRVKHELFLADLSVGDYVVHIDHGIARFAGITRMASDGTEREYLILEYAERDKLYVPSDQIDRVSRYIGPGGYLPSLSRLNTQEWARTKQRVKRAADELARELLAIYASREISEGIAFSRDTLWQQELEASFPYIETPDQMEAIRDIKRDMESPRPMDRLVCGDVGYGKTEVALRAAFKAVMDGKQVAVLVPTTVLAQQHFTTFTERLAAFPVEIGALSRFRSPRDQQVVLEKLANRLIDICIGTHRLLQKDVVFNDLGLVIIDEEQKFGVAHKERLKQLRSEVDVLTLSATPIPRTLHMSLIGVRDMSMMETPPEERLPIKTYVAEYSDELVREAILRELDRNGQVFFLHNRVQSIAFVAGRLGDLVPEARIAIAHGQMPEEALESAMLDFVAGKVDVLVCTTIIESGLDLPNVNTLIVNQSDKLGLTQLYHLRGRVGRGDVRAYAYFLCEKGKRLTEPAQKRLKTIFEATELGAGFRIAMKDLEIRGAGNILGPEQSGQMGAVGFDLYCRLLAQAVEELKSGEGRGAPQYTFPNIDLPLTAHIPESYVPDLNTRLALYRRLAGVDSLEQVRDMQQELEDRFGKLSSPVLNLLSGIRIKLLAAKAGVQKVSTEGRQIIITIGDGKGLDRSSLQRSFGSSIKVGSTQIRLDTKQLGKFWTEMLEQVLRAMKM